MRHLILGAGNLGHDLKIELEKKASCELWSKSSGVDFTKYFELLIAIKQHAPDFLWLSVGGGSVPDCKVGHPNHPHSVFLNTILPVSLNRDLPESMKIIFFSTDYVAGEGDPNNRNLVVKKPRSEYAKQKIDMERQIITENKPNRTIVRVSSLYGIHKPEKTFPGKILKNFAHSNIKINLPLNRVSPTPTRWLAFCLNKNLDKFVSRETERQHCAASGNISVKDWGKVILKNHRSHEDFVHSSPVFIDDERPPVSDLGCSFDLAPHWSDLWAIYFKEELYLKA